MTKTFNAEKMHLPGPLEHPPHESVAHVKTCPLRYLEAAEGAMEEGCVLRALHLISVAEGIAEALAAVTGPSGLRESVIRQMITRRSAEIRCEVARRYPEHSTGPAEADE
jgi:hypothetical protein